MHRIIHRATHVFHVGNTGIRKSEPRDYVDWGRKADITGEPGENGMMGYGDGDQKSVGVHSRQYARAFAFQDPATKDYTFVVVGDMLTGTNLIREQVTEKLQEKYGDMVTEQNLMITATHAHATPGGDTDYSLYNVTTMGVHQKTLTKKVNGIVEALSQVIDSLAPAEVAVGTSTNLESGVNRLITAWDKNPDWLKNLTPNGMDGTSITLDIRQNGTSTGVLNWFPTHATSLPTENKLISGDNKGFAEYLWEEQDPETVAAFAYSDGADQSPNLRLEPGKGPSDDPFESLKNIGERQFSAAKQVQNNAQPVSGIDVKTGLIWLDMQNQMVEGKYTATGEEGATCRAILGAPFGAGSEEDGGGGAFSLHEGAGKNPLFFEAISDMSYENDKTLKDCQDPKGALFESGAIDGVQTVLPVQRSSESTPCRLCSRAGTASGELCQ